VAECSFAIATVRYRWPLRTWLAPSRVNAERRYVRSYKKLPVGTIVMFRDYSCALHQCSACRRLTKPTRLRTGTLHTIILVVRDLSSRRTARVGVSLANS